MARTRLSLSPSLALLYVTLLGGCSAPSGGGFLPGKDGAPAGSFDVAGLPDALPREEPRSKYGNGPVYTVNGRRYRVMEDSKGYVERGVASWYGTKFHGRRTSSGEPYDMYAMSAAHRTLPLPTYVQVTNLSNGRSVVVRVNDRGPFHGNRIIDLSYAAAQKLDFTNKGTALVEVRAIDPRSYRPAPRTQLAAATPPPYFYLQVGSFASASNAEQLRERLRGHFQAVEVQPAAGAARQTMYRVRIGPLSSVEEADRMVGTLGGLGITETHIVFD